MESETLPLESEKLPELSKNAQPATPRHNKIPTPATCVADVQKRDSDLFIQPPIDPVWARRLPDRFAGPQDNRGRSVSTPDLRRGVMNAYENPAKSMNSMI